MTLGIDCPTVGGGAISCERGTPVHVGPYGGPRGGAFFYERGTHVMIEANMEALYLLGYLAHKKQPPPHRTIIGP